MYDSMMLLLLSRLSQRHAKPNTTILYLSYYQMKASLSDSQTSQDERRLSQLYTEIKVKDLALEKASTLIELLTMELQNSKESKEAALRDLEASLRQSYEPQLSAMMDKVNSLEVELSKICSSSTEYDSNQKKQVCKNLFKSFRDSEPKSSSSLNREYSPQSSKREQFDFSQLSKLQKKIYLEELMRVQDFQNEAFQELATTCQEEELELSLASKYTASVHSDLDEAFEPLPECLLPSKIEALTDIIRAQRTVINSLRLTIQEIEATYSTAVQTIQSASTPLQQTVPQSKPIDVLLARTRARVVEFCRSEKLGRLQLQLQNKELKGIVEGMIELIGEQRWGDSRANVFI